MAHPIMIPDDLYARLAAYAARQGQTPDEVLVALATEVVESEPAADESIPGYDPASDPLAPFIGAFDLGDDPGWIERHDEHFGGRHGKKKWPVY